MRKNRIVSGCSAGHPSVQDTAQLQGMRLSIFEQSAGVVGRSHDETLQETVALAAYAETLGYTGFWLGEHHDNPAFLGSAPEILMAAAAAVTRQIKIGSAGIMLLHYAPFKIAEQALTLAAIAPGRIHLGLGRSKGQEAVAAALEGRRGAGDFDDAVQEVLDLLDASDTCATALCAYPRPSALPSPHVLASSPRGAGAAARLGLPLIFNYSDGAAAMGEALALYRQQFRPSAWVSRPQVALSVWALAAETAEQADFLFQSRLHWRLRYMRGERVAMIAPDIAERHNRADPQLPEATEKHRNYFIGTADDIVARMGAVARDAGARELLVSTWAYDPAAKRHSMRLIIDATRARGPLLPDVSDATPAQAGV